MKETIKYLLGLISSREKEMGFDWRSSWYKIDSSGSDSLDIVFSRIELVEDIAGSIEGFVRVESSDGRAVLRSGPDKKITLVLAGNGSDTLIWAVSSVADLRREPQHSSELITQAIMGETMTRLDSVGDWFFVRMEDNYHGWVRSWSVAEAPRSDIEGHFKRANARVEVNVGYLLSTTEPDSIPVTDLVSGTIVETEPSEGRYSYIRVPGGKAGYFPSDSLGAVKKEKTSRADIVERAEKFIGIPYIWGGTSAKGFDCSGLVKRVFMMEGIDLPRDADQQASAGETITLGKIDTARPADLLFFADGDKITHVGIALGGGRFIHSYGDVRINSYIEKDPLYEEKLAKKLVFGRSIIP
ncbi:MAG: C40 family peptidase [Candidatus Krumholzibacteriota bacterium]|nr:C40 family peptidase [Candidatus Krumholzibacteriota bacterium]